MNASTQELTGTLNVDGTLFLDSPLILSPGRVLITVKPILDYTQAEIWQFFDTLDTERAARGYVPRTAEEVDAELNRSREADDQRSQEHERFQQECHKLHTSADSHSP